MKIKDLKKDHPKIYKLAMRNQKQQGNEANDNLLITATKSDGGFDWFNTHEGDNAWELLLTGDFDGFYAKIGAFPLDYKSKVPKIKLTPQVYKKDLKNLIEQGVKLNRLMEEFKEKYDFDEYKKQYDIKDVEIKVYGDAYENLKKHCNFN